MSSNQQKKPTIRELKKIAIKEQQNAEMVMFTRGPTMTKQAVFSRKAIYITFLLSSLLLSACGLMEVGIEDVQATQTAGAYIKITELAQTQQAGGMSLTPMPSLPSATPTLALSPTTPPPMKVKVFLILVDDNGQLGKLVGCGDSAAPVEIEIPYTQAVLRSTLENLLTLEDAYYQNLGLYNALSRSKLIVDDVLIRNGEAVVSLNGDLVLGGVCDNPRVQAQLEETILQFSTVSSVSIYINGIPLSEVLSLEG